LQYETVKNQRTAPKQVDLSITEHEVSLGALKEKDNSNLMVEHEGDDEIIAM
jgi:hypothetical protein